MHFLFHFSAISVLPFWAAMIFFPRAQLTAKLVASPWIVLPAALCYLALAIPHARELIAVFAAPSPKSLASVMAEPWAASMFWAYAGAFDLFVGRWIHLDDTQSHKVELAAISSAYQWGFVADASGNQVTVHLPIAVAELFGA